MVKGIRKGFIPTPHKRKDIGAGFLKMILNQADISSQRVVGLVR